MSGEPNEVLNEGKDLICPLCGGKIDADSPVVHKTRRMIRIAAALIPVGVIVAAAGETIAYLGVVPSLGNGFIGAGVVGALLCALFVKILD